MRSTLSALAAAGCVASLAFADNAFDAQMVVRVHVETDQQLQSVLELTDDVWSERIGIGGDIDVRLTPRAYAAVQALGLQTQIVVPDVGLAIDAERAAIQQRQVIAGLDYFDNFHPEDEIRAYVDALVAAHPDLASTSVIGQSIEGRDIWQVTITGPGDPSNRPEFAINATQHAREWAAPTTATYVIDRLIQTYGADPDVTDVLDHVVFHIIPVANPDGYAFTWADPDNRLWRKNRNTQVGAGCVGVDLNRNWGYEWGGEGSSGDPCNDVYRGSAPFSEPETTAIADYYASLDHLTAHIDFHTYGQWILYPWGYTSDLPPIAGLFAVLSDEIQQTIYDVHQTTYVDGPSYTTLYPAAGIAPDYVYAELGALSWTIELRPNSGNPGFLLPPDQILPTAEENFPAILAIAKDITSPVKVAGANLPPPPYALEPGQPQPISIDIYELSDTVTSVSLYYKTTDDDDYAQLPLTPNGELTWVGAIPAHDCGDTVEYYIEINTTGGATVAYPDDAVFSIDVLTQDIALEDDMETDLGWTVGAAGDDATTGIWERANPQPTSAQPGDDHTPDGTDCWITGASAGNGDGANDVDDGSTTLISPAFSAVGGQGAILSYWRWYSNNQGGSPDNDSMPVSISNNNGQSWTLLEEVTENAGAWVNAQFNIADYLEPTDQMKLRFVASDLGQGSLVEAGVDDLQVFSLGCDCPAGADFNGDANLNILDFVAYQAAFQAGDTCADLNGDGNLNVLDFVAFQSLFQNG